MNTFNKNTISLYFCFDNENIFLEFDNYKNGLFLKANRFNKEIKKHYSSNYIMHHKRKKSLKEMEKIFNSFKKLKTKEEILNKIIELKFIKEV